MKSTVVFFLLLFFASSLPAAVVSSGTQCPDQFIGKVSAVIEPAVDSTFSANKVIFSNLETLRGALEETVFVDILAGIARPMVGEIFKISLRKGVLCQIEKEDHH